MNMEPKELAILAAKALDEKKGKEINAIEVYNLTALTDYFVIASGSSNTQINALCDAVEKKLKGRPTRLPCAARAIAMAPGSCWTTAASASTCSLRRPVSSTPWSVCGVTASPWISAVCCSPTEKSACNFLLSVCN